MRFLFSEVRHAAAPALLCIICHTLAMAADLPPVAITIHPDAALVTCAGTLATDDSIITGLPNHLQAKDISVWIDQVDQPTFTLTRQSAAAVPIHAEAQAAHQAALAEVIRAQTTLQRALWHRDLVTSISTTPVPAGTPGAPAPLPQVVDPAWMNTYFTNLHNEYTAINAEIIVATAALTEAQLQAAQSEEALTPTTTALPSLVSLHLPNGAGHAVRVTYRLRGAWWAPQYSAELADDGGTLTRAVSIYWPPFLSVPAVPIQVSTRPSQWDAIIPPLSVPVYTAQGTDNSVAIPRAAHVQQQYDVEIGGSGEFMAIGVGGGAAGMFGMRAGGEKRRAVAKNGGTKVSESVAAGSLTWFKQYLRSDGSIQAGPSAVIDTSLVTLCYLAAGYDHKMPSLYRPTVASMLGWIQQQDPSQMSFTELCIASCALSEAYAMSNDRALRPAAQAAIHRLTQRIQQNDLQPLMASHSAFGGPEILAWAAMACKSAAAGELTVNGEPMQRLLAMSQLPPAQPDADEYLAAQAMVQIYSGQKAHFTDAQVQHICRSAAEWYRTGRVELLYFYTNSAFQIGGQAWNSINSRIQNMLVERQLPDGNWDTPHPAGPIASTAIATLCLEIYYRYTPASGGERLMVAGTSPATPPPLDTNGWPCVWTIPPTALAADSITSITIDQQPFIGHCHWQAIPVISPQVWRRFDTINTWQQPLPSGPLLIRYNGIDLPPRQHPFVTPGAAYSIPLDDEIGLIATRTATTASDDGFRSRTVKASISIEVHGPNSFTQPIECIEPLPSSVAEAVTFTLLQPDAKQSGPHTDAKDPMVRTHQRINTTQTIEWSLTYKTDLRPFTEFTR